MSNKSYYRTALSFSRLILSIVFNPSLLTIASIILWIIFSFQVALIYFIIVLVLRPFFSSFVKPRDIIIKENNDSIAYNLSSYANDNSVRIEECVSTVSFYMAEQMNYSVELFLNKKNLNYLATIISSFMMAIYYQNLILFRNPENEALSKTRKVNDRIHEEIKIHNKAINDSFKDFLRKESDEILTQIISKSENDINEIILITSNIINEHLEETAIIEMNEQIENHFKNYLKEVSGKYIKALRERVDALTTQ